VVVDVGSSGVFNQSQVFDPCLLQELRVVKVDINPKGFWSKRKEDGVD